jgi:hypothetical protein
MLSPIERLEEQGKCHARSIPRPQQDNAAIFQ